ncbi:UPF0769 protein C21orf59 A [Nymphon striatum]|nr:UPF0769 protein C21orf59 A [Nymphon striatum]
MVRILLKRNGNEIFLYEAVSTDSIKDMMTNIIRIYNGRLKLGYICRELEELCKYGVMLPPDLQGLDVRVNDLSLENEDKNTPGCRQIEVDSNHGRNDQAPSEDMRNVILKTITEARTTISEEQIKVNVSLTLQIIQEMKKLIQKTISLVYPMGLSSHDKIQQELENFEDLSKIREQMDIIEENNAELWWASKQMSFDKTLMEYVGRNEKTKIIVKLQRHGEGVPSREPTVSAEEQQQMMLKEFRKHKEMQELEENADYSYLNCQWADGSSLKCSFQGLNDISWKP